MLHLPWHHRWHHSLCIPPLSNGRMACHHLRRKQTIMTETFYKFQASIQQADHNVLIIFIIALGPVLAWYCLPLLPHRAQQPMRIIGWLYAVITLALTVICSKGG